MSFTKFLLTYGLTLLAIAVFLYPISLDESLRDSLQASYIAIAGFSFLCFLIFFYTKWLKRIGAEKQLFGVILLNILFKFVITGIVIYIYYINYKPETGFFIIPFLVVYVCFTVFETYFMNIQTKTS